MSNRPANIRLIHVKRACEDCAVRRLCLPTGLDAQDLTTISHLVERRGPIRKGDFRNNFV